jgi:hypothetical protein
MPDLQVALLEAARLDETPEAELSFHLDGCEDCQVAVERMRRMTATWMADPIAAHDTEGVIAAAAARFETRGTLRARTSWQDPASFGFVGAVAAAMMLVVLHKVQAPSSAPVASTAANPIEPSGEVWSPSRAAGARRADRALDPASKGALAVPHVEGPRGVTPLVDGLRIELGEGETATVALANGQSSEVHGPCAVEFWSSSNEVGGWRLKPVEPASSGVTFADPADPADPARRPSAASPPPPSDTPPAAKRRNTAPPPSEPAPREATPAPAPAEAPTGAVESASPKVQAAWVRAADAQRRDDFAAADSAYSELCEANDSATRDAARLARAQLWIAHGRADQVRSVLSDLAARGATQLVRQTARECLSRQAP